MKWSVRAALIALSLVICAEASTLPPSPRHIPTSSISEEEKEVRESVLPPDLRLDFVAT
jgi:hypothetical protein